MNQDKLDRPTPSLLEVAQLLIGHSGLINPSRLSGAILASDGKAWCHDEGKFIEVPFLEYERAIASIDPNEWPPNVVYFELAKASAPRTLTVHVQITYDSGLVEGSRGGAESEVTLIDDGRCWQIGRVDDTMFSD